MLNSILRRFAVFVKGSEILFPTMGIGLILGLLVWLKAQYWKRAFGRNRFFHLFALGVAALLLRFAVGADSSSRYSLIILLPGIFFSVYFARSLFLGWKKYGKWVAILLAVTVCSIHCGKMFRSRNLERNADLRAAALVLKTAAEEADYPIIFDGGTHARRIAYLGKVTSSVWDGPQKSLPGAMKAGENTYDRFFLCVSPKRASVWLEEAGKAFPDREWKQLFSTRYVEIYVLENPNPGFGRKPAESPQPLAGTRVFFEDFEKWRSYSVEADNYLKTIRERGAKFLVGGEWYFPEGWYLNSGHGFMAEWIGGLEIQPSVLQPLAGEYSLLIRGGSMNGIVRTGFFPAGKYAGRFLFRGTRGSKIIFFVYHYQEGTKFAGIFTVSEFYCLNDRETREGAFEFTVDTAGITEFAFGFSVTGEMELDDLELVRRDN